MRSGDDPSSKVKSTILVFDGGFGVALMKSSVAVQENCFGPVSEDIVMRFIRENALELIIFWPIQAAPKVDFTPLIATLDSLAEISGSARSSSHEVHQDILGVSF